MIGTHSTLPAVPPLQRNSFAIVFVVVITATMLPQPHDNRIKKSRQSGYNIPETRLFIYQFDLHLVYKPFDHLPEDVILHIFGYLAPDGGKPIYDITKIRDVASLSLVSRKLKRIVEPFLYQTIAITAGRATATLKAPVILVGGRQNMVTFHVPKTQGCNTRDILRTLRQRPDLNKYIKPLTLVRDLKAVTPDSLLDARPVLLPELLPILWIASAAQRRLAMPFA